MTLLIYFCVLLPVNGCHFLRAQFIPQLNSTQQINNPFACVAFNFVLNRDLYMVSLYTRGKETPRQNAVCKSESCWDELGPLNIQANVHQNAEYLIAVIFVILLFTPCVATAEGICSRVAVSSWMLCLNMIQGSTDGKEQRSPAGTASSEGFGSLQQSLGQPKTPGSSPGGDCAWLEEELEEGEAVSLPEE